MTYPSRSRGLWRGGRDREKHLANMVTACLWSTIVLCLTSTCSSKHSHSAKTTNSRKGLGAAGLPKGRLRFVWEIAHPQLARNAQQGHGTSRLPHRTQRACDQFLQNSVGTTGGLAHNVSCVTSCVPGPDTYCHLVTLYTPGAAPTTINLLQNTSPLLITASSSVNLPTRNDRTYSRRQINARLGRTTNS